MFKKTGVQSDRDIIRELGKGIFIWPFKGENLKGSTYNLTASIVARSVKDKKILVNDNREIIIPAGDTALIETDESIFVDRQFCGSYHSKVKMVSKGLSHIGTTLDPMFFGTSLIAVHNHSEEPQRIKVGESFVSVTFQKMASRSVVYHDNQPFRQDIINLTFSKDEFKYDMFNEDKDKILNEIEVWKEQPWRMNRELLENRVREYVRERDIHKKSRFVGFAFNLLLPILVVGSEIYYVYNNMDSFRDKLPLVVGVTALIFPVFNTIGKIIQNDIISRNREE